MVIRIKRKTLIGKTTSKHHHRLILLLLHRLKTYPKQVCTSKELSPDDQKIEYEALKQRIKFIENKYDKKNVYELETSNVSKTQTKLTTKIWTTEKLSPQKQNHDCITNVCSTFEVSMSGFCRSSTRDKKREQGSVKLLDS